MPDCNVSLELWAFGYALVTAAFSCGFGLACALRGCGEDTE